MYDFICVGNATVDAFLTIHEASLYCRLDKTNCQLCFKYGGKIPVEKCEFLLGGNACNASVGFSRLGLKTALMAEIGDDEFSEKIQKGLEKEGVDKALLLQTQNAQTSFTIGINFQGERTLLVHHIKREHNFSFEGLSVNWLYLTSLGEKWHDVYQKVLSYVKTNQTKLAFNPGTPQLEEGVGGFFDILKNTEVLLVNKEEGGLIVKRLNGQGNDPSKIIVQLHRLGPKIVVMTDGKNGSSAIDKDGKIYNLGFFPCKVVEKTGAGDAYASGFLAAVLFGLSVEEAMRWGAVNAASVIEQVGAQAGLLTRDQIEGKLLRQGNFQVELI